jgi:meiosis induction protein kinase IME2/SME1
MWDPRSRPTSIQALQHEYFRDAVDPLLPRSATPSRASRKNAELSMKPSKDSMLEGVPTLEKKNSWFRKSFIGGRMDGVVSPPPTTNPETRPRAEKRSTWHAPKITSGGGAANNGAPMMILPSIRPVSPLSDAVSAQAETNKERRSTGERAVKKIGRQLSVASKHSQEYGYTNGVQQAVDKLNGNVPGGMVVSPTSQKESFFSHLRKRARRLSGRTGLPPSPGDEDMDIGVGCGMWGSKDSGSNRSSMLVDSPQEGSGIDKAIKEVDAALGETGGVARSNSTANLRRNLSFPPTPNASRAGETPINGVVQNPTSFPRTRRSVRNTKQRYETPDEHDELANEVLAAASAEYGSRQSSQQNNNPSLHKNSNKDLRFVAASNGYPTPSPQATHRFSKGLDISGRLRRDDGLPDPKWPTPPSEGDAGWGQNLNLFTGELRD